MRKNKRWKYILFPCLSVAAISCVAIPAICVAAFPKFHMKYEGARWATITTPGTDTLDYKFLLNEPIDTSKEEIEIKLALVHFIDDNCHPELSGSISYPSANEVNQTIKLCRNDGSQLEPDDCTSFNIYIKLKSKENGKTIWSDSILNLELKYAPEE